jgi:hypothetical protein
MVKELRIIHPIFTPTHKNLSKMLIGILSILNAQSGAKLDNSFKSFNKI